MLERAIALPFRSARRVTRRTAKIAVVGNLHQRQAGVLFVVRTEAAIVRAAPAYRSVVDGGLLRPLKKNLTTFSVVVDVVGHHHGFAAVFGTALQHQNLTVAKDYFAFHLAEAARA